MVGISVIYRRHLVRKLEESFVNRFSGPICIDPHSTADDFARLMCLGQ